MFDSKSDLHTTLNRSVHLNFLLKFSFENVIKNRFTILDHKWLRHDDSVIQLIDIIVFKDISVYLSRFILTTLFVYFSLFNNNRRNRINPF
ncbi:MAG: hypothetical protein CME31_11835 [Gimesia sp.]|uniref:Uncharacterized protein n=1 Tax=Gimesia maris TaxID=122 RepID=A0A3D3RI22_9PLAN|nr:hypothetical protein [Gimesia sp.]HCO27687.1 hypothetical protein [Gimesia maris]